VKLGRVRCWLLPGSAERDEGFHQEILSLSYRGLRIIGLIEMGIAIFAFTGVMPWEFALGLMILGLATVLAARVGSAYPHNRLLAAVSSGLGVGIAALTIAASASEDFALGAVTVLALMAAAALPLLPLQSLGIGLAAVAAGIHSGHHLFLITIALAGTAITATLYAQRQANYNSYLGVLQSSQDLRALQSRLLRAESSATMVRLSAALAHELSSPIGTVSSAVDTLLALCARRAESPPGEQPRLAALQSDLGRSLHDSMARLKKIVNRIQRLTNLDEAATQRANINELLNDAVGLVKPQVQNGVHFDLNLRPLPDLTCRPQQLIAVFCNLLMNSIEAIDGDGRISVSTMADEWRLEVKIEDTGRGIPAERLGRIFDPGFLVADGRVSTGNWSLFTSRQFIKEHGGDIRIQSLDGKGTTVSLILPCSS
jgi:signal transduction histidine kinase